MATLTLTPLLLVITIGLSVLALGLRNHSALSANCRKTVFSAQVEMASHMTALLKLNPRAKSLRHQRQIAEKELKAAQATGTPPIIAAAVAHKAYVVSQQVILRAQQKALLLKARTVRAKIPLALRMQLSDFQIQQLRTENTSQDLAVYPAPPQDLTPDYFVQAPVEQNQAAALEFKAELLAHRPWWLKLKELPEKMPTTFICSASLKQEVGKWRAVLTKAKS